MPSAIGGLLGGMAVGKERDEQRQQRAQDNKLAQGRYDLQVSEQARLERDSLLNRRDTLLQAMPNLDPSTAAPWAESVAAYNKIAPPDLQISMNTPQPAQQAAVPGLSSTAAAPATAPAPSIPTGGVPGLSGVTGNHPLPMDSASSAPRSLTPPSSVGAAPPPKILAPRGQIGAVPTPAATADQTAGGGLQFGSPAAEAKWWSDKATAAANKATVDAIDIAIREGKSVMLEATTTLGKKFGSYAAALQQPPAQFYATLTAYIQDKMSEGWSYDALLESGLRRVYDDYTATSQYISGQMSLRGKSQEESLAYTRELRAQTNDYKATIANMLGVSFTRSMEGDLELSFGEGQGPLWNRLYEDGIQRVISGENAQMVAVSVLRKFGGQPGIEISTKLQPWSEEVMAVRAALGPVDSGNGESVELVDGQLYLHANGQDFLMTRENVQQLRAMLGSRKGGTAGVPLKQGQPPVPEMLRRPLDQPKLPEGVRH